MISVDDLIRDLERLHISHQEVFVEVQVDVDGKPHRALLGSMQFGGQGTRLTLMGVPAPTPDPVIAVPAASIQEPQHQHVWEQNHMEERWRCVSQEPVNGGLCGAVVNYEEFMRYPVPADTEGGVALLNALAAGHTPTEPGLT